MPRQGGASVGPHRPCLACNRLVVQFIPHLQFLVSFECLKWRFYCYTDNVKLQSEEERRSGRRYFRDVAVLVCFFSSFPLRLPSCSFWKQALLISNRFKLNTIHLSCYCYHYSSHLNYRSPLDLHLRHFLDPRHYFLLHFHFPDHHYPARHFRCFLHSLLDFRHYFLLHFLHFLLHRSLRPLLV